MRGYLSPVPRETFDYRFPKNFQFYDIELPVKQDYRALRTISGNKNKLLLVCGYWGQGPMVHMARSLRKKFPNLELLIVCGDNAALESEVKAAFCNDSGLRVFGAVPSLAPLLAECACMITKPGISTLLEGHAAGRKLFLLKGMPVAEDNNAGYALAHFNAEWFSLSALRNWLQKT